jgi:hypothetical protein
MTSANGPPRFEAADPLDNGYARINNCYKRGRAFFRLDVFGRVYPVHALSTRSTLASRTLTGAQRRARTCDIGGIMARRHHGSVRLLMLPNGQQ